MNAENDPLIRIVSVLFLQWMSAGPPNLLSLDSQYFWTGVAVRLSQEIGLYRDPAKLSWCKDHGLRRRIFWTLFVSRRGLIETQLTLIGPRKTLFVVPRSPLHHTA
jgi:hypothetical protein